MRREPSIHIIEKDFILVLSEIIKDNNLNKIDINSLGKQLVSACKKYSYVRRNIILSSQRLEKKTKKLMLSQIGDAILFSRILAMVRKKKKHVGIKMIKENTKDWGMIKECAQLALEFCSEFELSKKQGFQKYIDIALDRMNKFSINKFYSTHESVCLHYDGLLNIKMDDSPQKTDEMVNIYRNIILEKTGVDRGNFKNDPEKYRYFVEAKKMAGEIGMDGKIYIRAQFAGLEWANGIPEPPQLIGDKAKSRAIKYLYEKGIKIKSNKKRIKPTYLNYNDGDQTDIE